MKIVPIKDLKELAIKNNLRQAILVGWDGELEYVVTYGKSVEDCDQAAQGGDFVKKAMNWPENLQNMLPSRVQYWKDRAENAEEQLEAIREKGKDE